MMDVSARRILLLLLLPCLFMLGAFLLLWPDFDGEEDALWPSSNREDALEEATAPTVNDILDRGPALSVPSWEESGSGEEAADSSGGEKALLLPSGIFISGKVLDQVTGEPVQAYDFRLFRKEDGRDSDEVIHETVEDEKGRFSFTVDEGGMHSLLIRSSSYLPFSESALEIPLDEGLDGLLFELDPGVRIAGRVVEKESGKPVPDALVVPLEVDRSSYTIAALSGNLESLLFEYPESMAHAWSDDEGRFTLQGIRNKRQNLFAFHEDYAPGITNAEPKGEEKVEILLDGGYRVFGLVLDDKGRPLAGVTVFTTQHRKIQTRSARSYSASRSTRSGYRISSGTSTPALPVRTGLGGRYRTAPLLDGPIIVTAEQTVSDRKGGA